jgi:hypothetical protein
MNGFHLSDQKPTELLNIIKGMISGLNVSEDMKRTQFIAAMPKEIVPALSVMVPSCNLEELAAHADVMVVNLRSVPPKAQFSVPINALNASVAPSSFSV